MALEDADKTDNASAVPITTEATSPSERSRSDKREVVPKASQVASVPRHDAARFSHRGYDFHAFREGLPTIQIMCIVRDENADVALFSELGSSPDTMEAGKAVDAYGSQLGHIAQQNDCVQAYAQTLMQ